MIEIAIEIVEAAHASELAPLIAAFRDHLQSATPTDSQLRAHLPRALADPSIEFACARLRGNLVGYTQVRFFTSVWAPGMEAHLEDLFVLTSARRRTVGRALLRHAVERARIRGASRITLSTNDRNESARRLYRTEGFAPVSHDLYPGSREVLWGRSIGLV